MGGRHIPTISGNEPSDPFFEAEFAPNDSELVCDLHGYTVAEARSALDLFLDQAVADDLRCVKVIHGKGTGALATALQDALRSDARAKAFRPSNRGDASLLVLLKGG